MHNRCCDKQLKGLSKNVPVLIAKTCEYATLVKGIKVAGETGCLSAGLNKARAPCITQLHPMCSQE